MLTNSVTLLQSRAAAALVSAHRAGALPVLPPWPSCARRAAGAAGAGPVLLGPKVSKMGVFDRVKHSAKWTEILGMVREHKLSLSFIIFLNYSLELPLVLTQFQFRSHPP